MTADLREKFCALFEAALAARERDQLTLAKQLCEQALAVVGTEDESLEVVALGELGYLHRRLGDPSSAAAYYRRAVAVGPRSELASLGLFHSLVEQGQWELGLSEIVRFLRLKDSVAYRELLGSGFGADLPTERARRLAAEARTLLGRSDPW